VSFFLALGVGGIVALVNVLVSSERVTPTANTPATNTSIPTLPSPPTPPPPVPAVLESIEFETNRPLLFANINNDAIVDAVLLVTVEADKERFGAYAAFDGSTGKVLWRTASLGRSTSSLRATLVDQRLLIVNESGQLTGYDLANGTQQWTTALGERWHAFCNAKEPETVNVITVDERSIAVDIKTGKQGNISKAKPCEASRIDQTIHEWDSPRDRRDHSAPEGIQAIRCGSTRVLGSENYFVPDACSAKTHVDSDDMGGINASSLWTVTEGMLILGVKTPGSRIPMLGLWSKSKLAWKVEVPEGNPLDCNESAMRLATLSEDRVITTYTNKKTDIATLTAFAIASGARLWSTGIPKDLGRLLHLAVESGQLWVEVDGSSTKDAILVFDATTGKFRFGVTSGSAKVLTSLETAP
jgi:hypothetical protein